MRPLAWLHSRVRRAAGPLRRLRRLWRESDDEWALWAGVVKTLYAYGRVRAAARFYPPLLALKLLAPLLGRRYSIGLAEMFTLLSDAFFMRGQDARAQAAIGRAQALYQRVLRADPLCVRANKALALIYFHREEYDAARRLLEHMRSRRLADAEMLTFLGKICSERDEFDQAAAYFAEAIGLDPDYSVAHVAHSNLRPFSGDFAGKWAGYDLVPRRLKRHPASALWRGEPLAGRSITLFAVSGIGDEIRYACTYERVISMAARCVIVCEPRLLSLFRRNFPRAEVLAQLRAYPFRANGAGPRPDFSPPATDYYSVNLNAIQFLFKSVEECAARERLKADPRLVQQWRSYLARASGGRPVVGIDWRSGLMTFRRRREYMDLADWAPVTGVAGLAFVNLCYAGERELAEDGGGRPAVLLRPALDLRDDFDNLAALISCLDLVISAPTSTAELSGFLGTPTWLVESSPAVHYRWRCRQDGGDIWFPSVRHFNAHTGGGRQANIESVARALQQRFAPRHEHAAAVA